MYRGVIVGIFLFFVPAVALADICPSLSLGSSGAQVTAVQQILYKAYSQFPTPTGYFGSLTQAALKQWQGEHGISQTGTVGPLTGKAMGLCVASNSSTSAAAPVVTTPVTARAGVTASVLAASITRTLSKGMSGADVTALQELLISQNLLPSDSATGYFGALTEAAVQKFQIQKGIASSGTPSTTGYGAVGPKTRGAIVALSAGTKAIAISAGTSGASGNGNTNVGGGSGVVKISNSAPVSSSTAAPASNPNPAPAGTPACTIDTGLIDGCALQ